MEYYRKVGNLYSSIYFMYYCYRRQGMAGIRLFSIQNDCKLGCQSWSLFVDHPKFVMCEILWKTLQNVQSSLKEYLGGYM